MLQKSRWRPSSENSLNENETITVMRRPIPLIWGLVALGLFVCFAAVTQLQFNRINEGDIREAKNIAYANALEIYNDSVANHEACMALLSRRAAYKDLFTGVQTILTTIADQQAAREHDAIDQAIADNLVMQMAQVFPENPEATCPPLPTTKPERP